MEPLYPRVMGDAWKALHPAVRDAHLTGDTLRRTGMFHIEGSAGWVARTVRAVLRVPQPNLKCITILEVIRAGRGERWRRQFGNTTLTTVQWDNGDGMLRERFGIFEMLVRLEPDSGALIYRHVGTAIRLGPLRIPMPGWLSPRVEGREEPHAGGGTHVSVSVTLPLAGLLLAYDGHLEAEQSS